jgi:hypothetical protein
MDEIKNDLKNEIKKKAKEEVKKVLRPEFNPDVKLCENYMINKVRFCRFPKLALTKFCVHHQETEETYIKCPLDNHHVVAKANLVKHLEVCNITQNQ